MPELNEAVIVAATRSPIGRANKGSLVDKRADEMLGDILNALMGKVPQVDRAPGRGSTRPGRGTARRGLMAPRPLSEPHPSRLPMGHPGRQAILLAHSDALARGDAGYTDPSSGLFVLTAATLAARGECCEQGCRHCPYLA